MIWELAVSAILTTIAVITATVTIIYFLYRRYRRARALYKAIPHINSKYCRCYWCKIDRDYED